MIKDFLRKISALIQKEFIAIREDKKTKAIIFIIPIMQLLVFTNAATMEVRNINVVVLDNSKSFNSREILSKVENSPRFNLIYYANNEKEFKEKLDAQQVQVGLRISNDFARNIKAQKNTDIQIISDGRQTNMASIASGYLAQIITSYSQELQNSLSAKINYSIRNWFNPNLEYKWYILTVIVAMLSVITTLILTSLSIAREREMGTFDQLIVSPLSSFEILIGKSLPPLIIAMSLTIAMLGIAVLFFHIPFMGSFLLFLVSIFVSLLAIVGIGLFISSVCNTQQQAILSVMTFMMPAILLSGFISPIEDMPVCLQYVTCLNPIRFFISLSRGIILKGMGFQDVVLNLIPLIIIAFITLTFAGRTFKRKLG